MQLKSKPMLYDKIQLEQFDVTALEKNIYCDLFYDLNIYMQYIGKRKVKRTYRENDLAKSDIKRLIGLMLISEKELQASNIEAKSWIDFIDNLAYKLKFVDYDTKGAYTGYSSCEKTFSDNYITIQTKVYKEFLALSLQQQIEAILRVMVDNYSSSDNEFMKFYGTGFLDKFSISGSACGVLPFLKFAQIRHFLLNLLSSLQANIWYSTASLVQYLKYNHPYFLIPEHPEFKYKNETNRYYNFKESPVNSYKTIEILPDAIDAFEKVEGRYIERFLEYIPLVLGFVEVAYDFDCKTTIVPDINKLKAFKVTPRMHRFYNREIHEPKITVQPNFEVAVESEIYSAKLMDELTTIGKLKVYDKVSQVVLEKAKIIEKVASNHTFDPITYLRQLSVKPLPQNVEINLKEWVGQSDAIILYEGAALLESEYYYEFINQHALEQINKNLTIISDANSLLVHLEKECAVPIEIEHKENELALLPNAYKTLFPKAGKPNVIKELMQKREKFTITRQPMVKIFFPSLREINLLKNYLLLQHCIFDIDEKSSSILITKQDEPLLKEAIQSISNEYQVQIKDVKNP